MAVPIAIEPERSRASAFPRAPASRVGMGRVIPAAEWFVLIAVALYIGGRALPRAWGRLNTDFPVYYVTGRLFRESYSTERIYEWIWLQRQKNRMGIRRSDQPVVGFVPDTPFSALLVSPLTRWPPLTAKRIWIVINLALLVAVAVLLRSLTQMGWRRIALVIGLNYPLLRNLEYGQYYLIILFLMTAALAIYVRERRFAAGVLLGIAAGLKIFPGIFLIYFLRKRDLHAMLGLAAGALATVAIAVYTYGAQLHSVLSTQLLPWALRGEAMDPYNLASNSISSLLHKLWLFEPEWNPHPVAHSPMTFAVLQPLLQMLVLAPVIYLAAPRRHDQRQVQLEWSSFVVALLAVSTLPASYHFTVLILPIAVLASVYCQKRDYASLTLLSIVYLAICFPAWSTGRSDGWWALAGVPRLYFVLLLCAFCCITMFREESAGPTDRQVDRWMWASALGVLLLLQMPLTLRHQRRMHEEYGTRITSSPDILLATAPIVHDGAVGFIAMQSDGYFTGSTHGAGVHLNANTTDELSQTAEGRATFVEESAVKSTIRVQADQNQGHTEVDDAEFPVASADGKWLAYLRSNKARSTIWLRALFDPARADVSILPPQFDVEEMTFLPDGSLIFAATKDDGPSLLYVAGHGAAIRPLTANNARYPAASPDGRWLAYSKLDRGVWNLWLRDLRNGTARRITDVDCNDISPAWQTDSKTLIYASDCGRALWFTALYQRQVIP